MKTYTGEKRLETEPRRIDDPRERNKPEGKGSRSNKRGEGKRRETKTEVTQGRIKAEI